MLLTADSFADLEFTLVCVPERSVAIDGLERLLAAAAGCSRLVIFTGSGVSATSGVNGGST